MAETKDKLATLSQVKRLVESQSGGGGAQSDNIPLKLLAYNSDSSAELSFDLPSGIDEAEVTLVIFGTNDVGLFSVSVNVGFLSLATAPIYVGRDAFIEPYLDFDNRSITLNSNELIAAVYWIRSQALPI